MKNLALVHDADPAVKIWHELQTCWEELRIADDAVDDAQEGIAADRVKLKALEIKADALGARYNALTEQLAATKAESLEGLLCQLKRLTQQLDLETSPAESLEDRLVLSITSGLDALVG